MPKSKAVKRPKEKVAEKPAPIPANCTVDIPDVPAMYSLKGKRQIPFAGVEQRLSESRSYWICTSRPDGRPHSIPVWGFWLDGALYFGTARSTRKARNLAHNPAVSVHLESGDDAVIFEGSATEVDQADKLVIKKLDEASHRKYKMPLLITPEVILYSIRPRVILAWTEKDFVNSATRWKFT
jgi:nitroimidazol reductase NimA-like FMN-containing flavoprotein (pyridoxamine 5'-phosphate oxidase superfamily)